MSAPQPPYAVGQIIRVLHYGEAAPTITACPVTAITPSDEGPGWVLTVTTPRGGREYPVDHDGASDFIYPTTATG